jgi:aspartyl-tRNA(Asn)/glutamyl-tRNA(Gln) amidotransferase subunit A
MNSLAQMTLLEARQLLREGQITPEDLVPGGVTKGGASPLVWTLPGDEETKLRARSRGPLAHFSGVIKANLARKGWPLHCCSGLLAGHVAPYSATAVRKLEDSGAMFTGLSAMDEFGMGSSCEYAVTGPVANPWNPHLTPGGSSGGSAAAVASGAAWFALGSDTGGSIRFPAHCCGVVGLKPTYGRVSRRGLVAFASSLDTVGVLARGVADAGMILEHMAGHDPGDATSLAAPAGSGKTGSSLRGIKIGTLPELMDQENGPGLLENFQETMAQLVAAGVVETESFLPLARRGVAIYQILASAEAASNLARFDGSFYGNRKAGNSYQQTLKDTRTSGFGPEVKRRIIWGNHVLSEGYRHRYYLKARALRRQLADQFRDCWSAVDLLALPTAPVAAFSLGKLVNDPVAMHQVDVYTIPASLAGLPALTLPSGLDPDGRPLSLQLIGPPGSEGLLVGVGCQLEARLNFRARTGAPWNRV